MPLNGWTIRSEATAHQRRGEGRSGATTGSRPAKPVHAPLGAAAKRQGETVFFNEKEPEGR